MHGLPSGVERRLDRRVRPVEPLVALFLPAFGRHVLVEVALRIHEADADQRHAEVARFLAVIAGEHAEAAGVDRQRLVQRELGGEVRDRSGPRGAGSVCDHQVLRARARVVERRRWRGRRAARNSGSPRAGLELARAESTHSIRTGLCAVASPQPRSRAAGTPSRVSGASSTRDRRRALRGGRCVREGAASARVSVHRRSVCMRRRARRILTDRCCRRRRRRRPCRWPARPLSAAAMAQPAAPSAMTCARSATSFIARATSSSETTIDPASGASSGHIVGEHRLAAGAVDERRLPVLEIHRPPGGERRRRAARRFPVRRRRSACRASAPARPRRCPASRPPPPSGATIASTSGRSSRISSPTVPLPAMNRSSSNGWTKWPVMRVGAVRFDRAPALVVGGADDRRAEPLDRADLRLGRGVHHHDRAARADLARRERHALRGVAGADGPDAVARAASGGQLPDDVVGAADLERPDRLQQLRASGTAPASARRQPSSRHERRADRRAVDGGGRVADRGERDVRPGTVIDKTVDRSRRYDERQCRYR